MAYALSIAIGLDK